ncbi:Pcf11 cleavage and polyadenylation factor subunit [Carabus blaptoides fortunei]
MAKEIAEEYTSSLADLTLNSKPLINMLTMLADDNIEHAEAIVEAVEKHLEKVRSEYKLPVLYLIDSIVKNVGRTYTTLFTQNIVHTFCSVFEKVDEKVRAQMFKLRQTWNDVFAGKKLYTLDIRVQCIDPAWPITAPAPTPSIHVNPKFFSKPATPVPAPATVITNNKLAPPAMDAQTLDMQTQLINKQKELLELKQKKLELELLQAKAKLEEQQKQLERQTIQIKTPQQLPVKSEPKPYVPGVQVKLENDVKPQITAARGMPPPLTAGGPRIAPVNSALLNSVRPIVRDPRLLRQQQQTSPTSRSVSSSIAAATTTQIPQITSNNFENVNIDEKHKVKSKSHNTISLDCANNDKASVNKSGAQSNTLTRKDPRLLSNKVQGSAANKSKSNNGRPVSNERSPTKAKLTTSSSRKSSSKSSNFSSSLSSSRSFKSSGPQTAASMAAAQQHNNSKVLDGSNSSSTTGSIATDGILVSGNNHSKNINNKDNSSSTSKGNSDMTNKASTLSSPTKYKKKTNTTAVSEHSSSQQHPKRSKNSFAGNKSRSRDRPLTSAAASATAIPAAGDKYDDDSLHTASSLPVAVSLSTAATSGQDQRTFKGLKVSAKNRNYMRRNRTVSVSPEPTHDVDLRVGGPPEKQARLQPQLTDITEEAGKSTTIDDNPANKDVDLRTLVVPAVVNKKRSSTEKLEASVAKKSKSQMFDVLFGNEDVDLRQLPPPILQTSTTVPTTNQSVLRPPTPPPPIISTPPSSKNQPKETDTWARTKDTKTNFEAIRAKLANATKISTFSEDGRKNTSEDTDMRLKSAALSSESAEDVLQKIIISQADEQLIKNGNLSQALVERVLTLFETQKLKEAQRRESEEVKSNEFGNITLTPISDDELSAEFSHSESDDDTKTTRKSDIPSFGDTDERIPPPAPVISQSSTTVKDTRQSAVNSTTEHQKSESNIAGHVNVDPRLQSGSRLSQQNMDHGTAWHGHHRRRRPKTHWDSPPPPHPGTEQWIRPPPAALNQQLYGMRRSFQPFVRPPADNFGPRMENVMPSMVLAHVLENTRTASPPTIGSQNTKELPMADPLVLEYIDQDTMRTINIDGRPREIRYYDETAIVILSWDDPREISFQNGSRVITFDDKETFTLSFNDTYRDVTIGGNPHRIRLGAPTRELYIDGKWYECFFGGPGIGIEVDGKMHVVKMDGPPPHVKIGTVKRTDLVAGKINLIINARTMVPVFLDAKPQKFDIEGKIHTLRFVDALKTVLINEVPFKVEFGGLPKPITVHDKKHFIRFSVLPRGIKPGYIKIANMEGQRYPSPPRTDKESSNDATPIESINVAANEPALPMLGKRRTRPSDRDSPDSARNSPTMQNASLHQLGSLDVLSSIITSPMANSNNVSGYQLETRDPSAQDSQDGFPIINPTTTEIPGLSMSETTATSTVSSAPFLPPNLNINDLFQKLVASGIVTSAKEKTPPPSAPKQEEPESMIRPVLFTQTETLKTRQQPLIAALFSGMQCSSCGVRFPPEHSMQYSQHLDWHFRQNRRGRNSARKALCRKWYYDVSDWKNFEEIEDIEEREKNWFESQQQQQQAEGVGEDGDEEIEIPSVPADSNTQDTCCDVCHDKFEQFYNEEKEEWHLRMAIRAEEKTYHPLCYDDYKASLINATLDDTFHNSTLSDNIDESKENTELKDEESEIKQDETELTDTQLHDELVEADKMEVEETAREKKEAEEEEDDDVVIEEPNIEHIDIDDKLDTDDMRTEDDKDDAMKIDDSMLPGGIKIKQEPMDDDVPDDEMCLSGIKTEPLDPEMEDHHVVNTVIAADTTHAEVVSSIDGNVQLSSGPSISQAVGIAGKIKINITKPLLASKDSTSAGDADVTGDGSADSAEPLPPGEEPVQLNLKPALQGLTLVKQPIVSKGTELTGLCSIM